jgi:hypothetical protein
MLGRRARFYEFGQIEFIDIEPMQARDNIHKLQHHAALQRRLGGI